MLERKCHEDACFVTLTYSPEQEPKGRTLNPVHAQNWLKELRHVLEPKKIRFFLTGEYGEQTQRPHYHAILFGLNALIAGGLDGNSGLVAATWKKGFSTVRDLTESRCAYVAGYVDKKITGKEPPRDPRKRAYYTDGRYGQFIRMSMRPGIGRAAAEVIGGALSKGGIGTSYVQTTGNLPTALRHGRIMLPLGRYLRGKILDVVSDGVAVPEPGTLYRETLAQKLQFERLQELRKVDEVVAEAEKKSVGEIMLDRIKQKNLNIAAREAINKPRGTV